MNHNNQQPGSADLLPCPFCGDNPTVSRESLDERFAYANQVKVQCSACGVSVSAVGDTSKPGYADNSTTEARAFAAWNRRVPSPQIAEELPPLPEKDVHAGDEAFGDNVSAFSGAAMQQYARDAIAASRPASSQPDVAMPKEPDARGPHKAKARAYELLGRRLAQIARLGHNDRWSALEKLAKAADQGEGQHIYTNPRDSNGWEANAAWHRAASPALFLELVAIARRAGVTEPELKSMRDTCR